MGSEAQLGWDVEERMLKPDCCEDLGWPDSQLGPKVARWGLQLWLPGAWGAKSPWVTPSRPLPDQCSDGE
ncbi:hypothetical protein NDU88_006909 [Pleurodeles waltl]|uniref:Uncharacterized protein n=1 Tax=Pleurodeles waltl TaxID=8319 RepID=A0AAV7RQ53_PLEWA|nr:hypothetical protein NDU88_006909 [Pleurodeles waltl]